MWSPPGLEARCWQVQCTRAATRPALVDGALATRQASAASRSRAGRSAPSRKHLDRSRRLDTPTTLDGTAAAHRTIVEHERRARVPDRVRPAPAAVVRRARPVRLAELTASGPSRRASARGTTWSGTRTPRVVRPPVSSSGSTRPCPDRQHEGQRARARTAPRDARAAGGTCDHRPSAGRARRRAARCPFPGSPPLAATSALEGALGGQHREAVHRLGGHAHDAPGGDARRWRRRWRRRHRAGRTWALIAWAPRGAATRCDPGEVGVPRRRPARQHVPGQGRDGADPGRHPSSSSARAPGTVARGRPASSRRTRSRPSSAAVEGDRWAPPGHRRRGVGMIVARDVRQVRHAAGPRAASADRVEEVREHELDAVGDPVGDGVLDRHGERVRRDVAGRQPDLVEIATPSQLRPRWPPRWRRYPVPTSQIRTAGAVPGGRGVPVSTSRGPARTARSTSSSVSGRGMSTRSSTENARPWNSRKPRMYATGSPREAARDQLPERGLLARR